MSDLDERVRRATAKFWSTRTRQAKLQGQAKGVRDAGMRTAVTGGKHLSGYIDLCRELLIESDIPDSAIHIQRHLELPGYFPAEKNWDLLTSIDGQILVAIEFKAQVGPSFGNNFNNRTEEALGNATDLWAAYREGAFQPSIRPWLGYVFILEECEKSLAPVKVKTPHFDVFPEFRGASYAKRYEIMLEKLVRERLYDSACLMLTPQPVNRQFIVNYPGEELSFRAFATSLTSHALAHSRLRPAD